MTREPVVQEHSMGCAVACIAFVACKSYDEVLDRVNEEQAVTKGFDCEEIVTLLGKGYRYERVCAKNSRRLQEEGVIVFVSPNDRYPLGHYLARSQDGWMNPWVNIPRIAPAKAGFEKELPGTPEWIVFRSIHI